MALNDTTILANHCTYIPYSKATCWEKKVIIAFFTKAKIYTFSTIRFIAHIVSNDTHPGVGAIILCNIVASTTHLNILLDSFV
jgi:hypothetical protein